MGKYRLNECHGTWMTPRDATRAARCTDGSPVLVKYHLVTFIMGAS